MTMDNEINNRTNNNNNKEYYRAYIKILQKKTNTIKKGKKRKNLHLLQIHHFLPLHQSLLNLILI